MIEVWGRPLVAETKKKAEVFRYAIAGRAVHIYQFEPPQRSRSIPQSQFEAARCSTSSKEKTFRAMGCSVISQTLPWQTVSDEFRRLLARAVFNPRTAGIIIQNPMPRKLKRLLEQIPYEKDIDGLRKDNPFFKHSATSETIARLVNSVAQPNDVIAVVGAKGFVGKGVVELLGSAGLQIIGLDEGDRLERTLDANIVVTATGVPELLDSRHIAPHHRLVVDSGFIPLDDGSIKGDVNRSAYAIPQALTPVPGGVGPMQMATLVERLVSRVSSQALEPWSVDLSQLLENTQTAEAAAFNRKPAQEHPQEQAEAKQQERQLESASQPELQIPKLQTVSNPMEQFKLDVAAFKDLLRQGISTIQAVSLLNFNEVAATQRPHNTHPENYVNIITTTAAREVRLESLKQPPKKRSPDRDQQRRPRPRRSL